MIIGLAALLAVWIGGALAGGSVGLAALAALVSSGFILTWSRWIRPETALLGFAFAGYFIGNRGFAQIMPYPSLPLLFGEAVLAGAGGLVLVQAALRRQRPILRDALNLFLIALIAMGCARMVIDFREFGLWALRDFATIYYIAYFFIVQAVAIDERENDRLGRVVVLAAAVLPFVTLLSQRFPDFFLTTFTLNGIPLIFMKEDLAATFLLAGLFPLLAIRRNGWLACGSGALAGLALLTGFGLLSRAALVGFAVAALWSWCGRQRRVLAVAAVALPLGLAAALAITALQQAPWRDSRAYALYEHVISIADVRGSSTYVNADSADSGANNRFRVVWWQSITARVLEENPVFGLGFGYDLSRDFVSTYEGVGDDFAVRSPHSIVFTILGRTGFFGLTLFMGFVAVMIGRTQTAARAARAQLDGAARALAWWCACWVILISACFGVVLENPMGAVVFWILLGLAHASTKAVTEAAAAMKSAESHDPSLQTESEPAIR